MTTLITECFFLVTSEKQLKDIVEILTTKCSNIFEALIEINSYILKNKITALLIIDQYQKKLDPKKIILELKNFEKLFILSSINDKEIKENLKLKLLSEGGLIDNLIKEQIEKEQFFYHYYNSLLDQEDYLNLLQDIPSDKMQELKILKIKTKKTDKAKDEAKKQKNIQKDILEDDSKLKFIELLNLLEILGYRNLGKVKEKLEKFKNIPEYYFNYLEIYNSIFDFINMEFQRVFNKIRLSIFK